MECRGDCRWERKARVSLREEEHIGQRRRSERAKVFAGRGAAGGEERADIEDVKGRRERGSTERKKTLNHWFRHYGDSDISCIFRLMFSSRFRSIVRQRKRGDPRGRIGSKFFHLVAPSPD